MPVKWKLHITTASSVITQTPEIFSSPSNHSSSHLYPPSSTSLTPDYFASFLSCSQQLTPLHSRWRYNSLQSPLQPRTVQHAPPLKPLVLWTSTLIALSQAITHSINTAGTFQRLGLQHCLWSLYCNYRLLFYLLPFLIKSQIFYLRTIYLM